MQFAVISAAILAAAAALPSQLAPAASSPPDRAAAAITWDPSSLVNGAPCIFRVRPPFPLTALSGLWLARPVVFDFDPGGASWFGLAGVGLDVTEGVYPLELDGVAGDGSRVSFRAMVAVSRGAYRTRDLSVARKFTAPDARSRARIAREQELKRQLFARVTADRVWSGPFAPPIATEATESFGVRRTFNGVQESVHQGSDYPARTGTPVTAMNRGRVVLAKNLFFEGRCVVIDHGRGLMTLYMHLSTIKVGEGDLVDRGQQIGTSGATGRTTGPHLHVGVRWHGIYLDPRILASLSLP